MRRALVIAAIATLAAPASAAPKKAERPGKVERLLYNPPGEAPILGPRYAPVTVELFLDLRVRSSARAYHLLRDLARRHPLRLRVVFRVASLRGRPDYRDHRNEIALEAAAQGRFHEYLAAYYGDRFSYPGRDQLDDIAAEAGLDTRALAAAVADGRHAPEVHEGYARSRRFGLPTIPALLVNGEPVARIPGSLTDFEELYDKHYAEARRLLDAGYPVSEIYPRLLRRRAADLEVPRIELRGKLDGRRPRELRAGQNGIPLAGPIDYSGPHTRGPADAPVVIVTFCRLGGSECHALHRRIAEIREAYKDQVRHVFKSYFDFERHPQAATLHLAAECAGAQGQFWDMWERIVQRGRIRDADELIERMAPQLEGLDETRFQQCMSQLPELEGTSPPKSGAGAALLAEIAEARAAGVDAIPATLIGGRIYFGQLTFEELASLVEIELAPGLLGGWLDPVAPPPSEVRDEVRDQVSR